VDYGCLHEYDQEMEEKEKNGSLVLEIMGIGLEIVKIDSDILLSFPFHFSCLDQLDFLLFHH
jgi:hypothetical protein